MEFIVLYVQQADWYLQERMFLLFLWFMYEIRRQLCRYNWFNNTLRLKFRVT